jgi:tetratricopeptide (TPR) repeat protein
MSSDRENEYFSDGMTEELINELAQPNELSKLSRSDPISGLTGLALTYAEQGRREEAQKLLDTVESLSKQSYVSPVFSATIYGALGDTDRAFDLLEEGYRQHASLMSLLKVQPIFDPLRSDPRFDELLRKMNLE